LHIYLNGEVKKLQNINNAMDTLDIVLKYGRRYKNEKKGTGRNKSKL